ncbi:MAG: HD domain-containing protein [Gemmatimonadetes bacterium]|nr:HD domain-containing protein [Gemmatimonadota bacterium]
MRKSAPHPTLTTPEHAPETVAVGDVLAALSHALDLTEGQPLGHSVRSCLIGMRLGEAVGLGAEALGDLYHALLLKDAGCSSNAARIASLFGSDDQVVKPRMKVVDWDDRMQLALATWRHSGMRQSLGARVRHFVTIARQESMTRDLITTRCERGAEIARRLGFSAATQSAIRSLDEHWNGGGYPDGLAGEAIPQLARILNIAQTIEVYWGTEGPAGVDAMLQDRRGSWFDPALVDVARDQLRDPWFWQQVADPEVTALVASIDPLPAARTLGESGLDAVAEAFAEIIDAKSPFTFRHSSGVARYAVVIGEQMGLDAEAKVRLRRAGLLHDIGKLGVSNRILDKNGPLDAAERTAIEQHPLFTWEILRRVTCFADFARQAAQHHERLDGTGYPWGIGADELDLPSRILAVADTYEAVTASRPYRPGMSVDEALAVLEARKWRHLDPQAIEALASVVTRPEGQDL